jgi:hypothetical protein
LDLGPGIYAPAADGATTTRCSTFIPFEPSFPGSQIRLTIPMASARSGSKKMQGMLPSIGAKLRRDVCTLFDYSLCRIDIGLDLYQFFLRFPHFIFPSGGIPKIFVKP